jgi:DNA-binding transcriptional LysR family regulator
VQLDLNLLTALDALLAEGSVGGAATRLGLSQPAMSRALGRVRRATGDQILVRAGRTMLPTPYAVAVREQVHALVTQAETLLTPPRQIDPAALAQTFTLCCNDALTDVFGPVLLTLVRAAAPGVRLRFLAETPVDTDDLRSGRVDLDITAGEARHPELRTEVVGSGTLIAVVRADGPVRRLSLKAYAGAEHVIVSRRGRLRDPIDDALESRGLTRRVVATTPTTAAAVRLVGASDLVAAVPSVIAGPGLVGAGVRAVPLPLEVPAVPLVMSWHHRYEGDAAHAWLRGRARQALRSIGVPSSRGRV